jgi:hypothetical protein
MEMITNMYCDAAGEKIEFYPVKLLWKILLPFD